jgi:hypothetical protein
VCWDQLDWALVLMGGLNQLDPHRNILPLWRQRHGRCGLLPWAAVYTARAGRHRPR